MKIAGKDFDKHLRLRYGTEEYHDMKSKAGTIGGYVSRCAPEQYRKNGIAFGYSNLKHPREVTVLCLQDYESFQAGHKYKVTLHPGAVIEKTYRYEFHSWNQLLKVFKIFKDKK